jgi:hypothetical protein
LTRLDHVDRATAEVVRRYERDRPGDLVHVDVKKFALIPSGGGWKVHGRAHTQPGRWRREDQRRRERQARGAGKAGWEWGLAFFATQGIRRLRTQPYRPQINGEVDRFQRTLRDEWGYTKGTDPNRPSARP